MRAEPTRHPPRPINPSIKPTSPEGLRTPRGGVYQTLAGPSGPDSLGASACRDHPPPPPPPRSPDSPRRRPGPHTRSGRSRRRDSSQPTQSPRTRKRSRWLTQQSFWLMEQSFWLMKRSLWLMKRSLWLMEQSFWLMERSFWLMERSFWLMKILQKSRSRRPARHSPPLPPRPRRFSWTRQYPPARHGREKVASREFRVARKGQC